MLHVCWEKIPCYEDTASIWYYKRRNRQSRAEVEGKKWEVESKKKKKKKETGPK